MQVLKTSSLPRTPTVTESLQQNRRRSDCGDRTLSAELLGPEWCTLATRHGSVQFTDKLLHYRRMLSGSMTNMKAGSEAKDLSNADIVVQTTGFLTATTRLRARASFSTNHNSGYQSRF